MTNLSLGLYGVKGIDKLGRQGVFRVFLVFPELELA
jgi:hypothetical protein